MGNVGQDIFGNIALLKFDSKAKLKERKQVAKKYLEDHKSVSTVLEKIEGFKGRLRKQKTNYLVGDDTKEVLYKENDCIFRFNIDTCYFSPRLSSERLEIANLVKKNENILVMFGGVAPFAIVMGKHSKAKRIVSVEISRECSKYAKINVKRNKLNEKVEIVQGDVKKQIPKIKEKFDRIVMARPQLKESFLLVAFKCIKKGGIMHYYGFYPEDEKESMLELINEKAKIAKKKVKILKVKKAGDIGPYKYRYRADIKVLS